MKTCQYSCTPSKEISEKDKLLSMNDKKLLDFEILEKSIKEIKLEEVIDIFPKMLKGETSGRYVINLDK